MGLNIADIAVWWLVFELIGFIALPLITNACHNLKDRGYSIAKPLGLLFLTYASWIISIFVGYSYLSILLSLIFISICSFIICLKRGLPRVDMRYALWFEIFFAAAFVIFALIRSYSPDIYWTGGEKFMDITFINALIRSTGFPLIDPWMSGVVTYYYYFGYLIVSNLIKLSGILPAIAFNLATASFFALSFTTALGIGYNLTDKIKYGVITAFLVTMAGNLAGFFQLLDILSHNNGGIDQVLNFNYWTSSRVIPDTINEFPFFSYLQGDVHAHMIAITFQLTVILLLLNLIRSAKLEWDNLFVTGLAIGFLYPLNTWDYPVYLFVSLAVIAFNLHLSDNNSHLEKSKKYIKYILPIFFITVLSYSLYLPYHFSNKLDKMVSLVPQGRTSLIFYLVVYGLFLFLIYTFILRNTRNLNTHIFKFSLILLSIAALITIFEVKLFILNDVKNPKTSEFELLILLIPLLILSVHSIFKEKDRNNVFILILIFTGVLTSLFCEFFYIQDALGSGNPAFIRLNTVFKMYIQNWVIWGICAGYIIFHFRDYFNLKNAWSYFALFLILMVSVYPVFAIIGKSGDFKGIPSLNGEDYLKKEHASEYTAILWLRNISGQPVVLQAPGELYNWNTYITAFTGLPTVIGWAGHELNWRYPNRTEIDSRWSDVTMIYTSSDLEKVDALIKKYNIKYIYFGEAEIKRYGSGRFFDSHPERFERVFEQGEVEVYKII